MGYRPALDGFRALAIGLVLVEHTGLELFDGGNSGVILFFVLSGFLITKLMLEEWAASDTLDVRAFWGRRAVRIMPAPMVMVGVVFALSFVLLPASERSYLWFELFMVVFYLTNLRPVLFGDGALWGSGFEAGVTDRFMAHTWSLSVEEHFYLVWPLVFLWFRLPERAPRRVIGGLAALTFGITVSRFVFDRAIDPDLVAVSLMSFDGFALGALLAFGFHSGVLGRLWALVARGWVFAVAMVVLAADLVLRNQIDAAQADGPVPYQYWYYTTIGLVGVAAVAHLYHHADGPMGRLFSWGPAVWVGRLSYSLYLWHVPIQVYLSRDRFPGLSLWEIIVIEQILTVGAALASYYLIEQPARRWRHRFVPRAQRTALSEPAVPRS